MNAGSISAQGSYKELRSSDNHSLLFDIDEGESPPELEEDATAAQEKLSTTDSAGNHKQNTDKETSPDSYNVLGILKNYFKFVNNKIFLVFVFTAICLAQLSNTFVSIHIAHW